jgi:hypothetical protein
MNRRSHALTKALYILVPVLIALALLILWSFYVETTGTSVVTVPTTTHYAVPITAVPTNTEIDSTATSTRSLNAFHSKTIDEHLARLAAERLEAEKAAAEKAEAERLAAERAAAELAAASSSTSSVVTPPAAITQQHDIVYRGMMNRIDGTLLAFIEDKTDATTLFYKQGDSIFNGIVTNVQAQSIVVLFEGTNQILMVNIPTPIVVPK